MDTSDKMPHRVFLPRDIAMKIPFQTNTVLSPFDKAMRLVVGSTVAECERAPSSDESKRCTTSA
jgi:hypothetical protein